MPVNASQVRFGIEIECCFPAGRGPRRGGYHSGTQISWAPRGWNAQSDCSIQAPHGYKGCEIVSPILQGQDGLLQVLQVVDKMIARGAVVNESCGLHVHVDGNLLDSYHLANLVEAFRPVEKLFFGLSGAAGAARENNHYCRPIEGLTADSIAQSRYQSLNVTNWYGSLRKRTVEFRCWAATLDLDDILTAISMSVGLVAGVVNDQVISEAATIREIGRYIDQNRIMPEAPVFDLVLNLYRKSKQADATRAQRAQRARELEADRAAMEARVNEYRARGWISSREVA